MTYKADDRVNATPRPLDGSHASYAMKDDPDAVFDTVFLVHEHRSTTHRFDFRIEVDGVLKSWAASNGPSTGPEDRRLGVDVEDRSPGEELEGADEGRGPGAMILWDAGSYRSHRVDDAGHRVPVAEQLQSGRAELWLEGRKLRGGYALIRRNGSSGERNWLLVKMKDDAARATDGAGH